MAAAARNSLGLLASSEGRFDDAISHFTVALNDLPSDHLFRSTMESNLRDAQKSILKHS